MATVAMTDAQQAIWTKFDQLTSKDGNRRELNLATVFRAAALTLLLSLVGSIAASAVWGWSFTGTLTTLLVGALVLALSWVTYRLVLLGQRKKLERQVKDLAAQGKVPEPTVNPTVSQQLLAAQRAVEKANELSRAGLGMTAAEYDRAATAAIYFGLPFETFEQQRHALEQADNNPAIF
jgi:hypothetical protein